MKITESTILAATNGDRHALERIILSVQDMIYNIALKMLWHPEDAQDATQEILLKVITNLSSFESKSTFNTWVYRLSINTLINFKNRIQQQKISFEAYAIQLHQGFADDIHYTSNESERKLLIIEAKVGCSNAMLQCLNADSRLVYILGEILEFNSTEASFILDIPPSNFRKKLSRARIKMNSFLQANCGIINPKNTCRCHKKVDDAIQKKRINPQQLLFAKTNETEQLINSIHSIQTHITLYQSNPEYQAPETILHDIKNLVTKYDPI